jgi:DNA-binding LacI/PurR family transcriptional regulator
VSLRRTTAIGVLTDWLPSGYQLVVLRSVLDAAREHDISVVCFATGVPGGKLWGGRPLEQLIGSTTVDGLVVLPSTLAGFTDGERVRFLDSVRPLPLCGIGSELLGASGVFVDGASGLRDAVTHLVRRHGHRRIGFVAGPAHNAEAQHRLAVFQAALAEHSLEIDPRLMLSGDFTIPAGADAIRTLFDERRVPVDEVDALVAANDAMAWGCLDALAARGVRVPSQVAVVGFDDLVEAGGPGVPLTTVRQPVYDLGRKAVELLLAQIAGAAPDRAVLPTRLVTRRSCGCLEGIGRLPLGDADLRRRGGLSFEVALLQRHDTILADMERAARGQLGTLGRGWGQRMVTALVDELKGRSPDAFRLALDDALARVMTVRDDPAVLHEVVSALWRHLIPCVLGDPALRTTVEGLLDGARLAIALATHRVQAVVQHENEALAEATIEACASLNACVSLADVGRVLELAFPALGVSRLVIALDAGDGNSDTVRRVLSLDQGLARVERTELRLSELAAGALHDSRRSELVVLPLCTKQAVFGVVCMELSPVTEVVVNATRLALGAVLGRIRDH